MKLIAPTQVFPLNNDIAAKLLEVSVFGWLSIWPLTLEYLKMYPSNCLVVIDEDGGVDEDGPDCTYRNMYAAKKDF
jgi:hypothetical protein